MAANDDTYNIPSLMNSAFNACVQSQRNKYYEKDVRIVDLKNCCKALFEVLKLNMEAGTFDPLGDRQSMFTKVRNKLSVENICEEAAFYGHIECMKFARAIGVLWLSSAATGESACDRAISAGNLDCLVYAIENLCPANEETCGWAAWEGQLECLKYLHNIGIPWHSKMCNIAANRGHLDCLKYVHENGCHFDRTTYSFAVLGKHEDCIQYVFSKIYRR
ncbi:uncharacterized protein LOC111033135 [Myzus persicae]|uniref:uncharacterized protein LOC111033135 n=1 Tax=Myzus persicae TaxID=13164 RepID=UPI000B930CA0|nr:uncharacterized protein LOC111033135 [Myzus persicae]